MRRLTILSTLVATTVAAMGAAALMFAAPAQAAAPPVFKLCDFVVTSVTANDLRNDGGIDSVFLKMGTTSTTSIDPVPDIVEVCEPHAMWLHVDAAYAGSAALVPEMRHVLKGCHRADSLVLASAYPLAVAGWVLGWAARLFHAVSLLLLRVLPGGSEEARPRLTRDELAHFFERSAHAGGAGRRWFRAVLGLSERTVESALVPVDELPRVLFSPGSAQEEHDLPFLPVLEHKLDLHGRARVEASANAS